MPRDPPRASRPHLHRKVETRQIDGGARRTARASDLRDRSGDFSHRHAPAPEWEYRTCDALSDIRGDDAGAPASFIASLTVGVGCSIAAYDINAPGQCRPAAHPLRTDTGPARRHSSTLCRFRASHAQVLKQLLTNRGQATPRQPSTAAANIDEQGVCPSESVSEGGLVPPYPTVAGPRHVSGRGVARSRRRSGATLAG